MSKSAASAPRRGGGGNAKKPAQDAPKPTKRGTRPGSIRQVRLRLWWAIEEASGILDHPDTDTKLKAISAMNTACGAYGNLTRTHAIEAEVEAMQKDLHELRKTLSRPANATERSAAATVN